MRRIKSKDTSIEILLRKELWKRGLRYRKNAKDVFGKPDIVFKGKKLAVFADSEFWVKKINRNIERDKEVNQKLKDDGWTVLRFWESDIRKKLLECIELIEETLNRH